MSFETVLSDDREEQRFQEELRAKKARRGQISQANEAREMVKRASAKCSTPQKSPIQLEYEQGQARRAEIDAELLMQEQLQKQGSSASLDRLQREQQQRLQTYYDRTIPADKVKDKIREDLQLDQQPETRHLEAFSLGSFNPDTKEFGDITYYDLEIMQQAPLKIKNSHVREASKGRVLVASMKSKFDHKEKMINITNGIPAFGGGIEKIILPVKLITKHYKGKTMSGSAVNDLLLRGHREIDRGGPEVASIVSAHDLDRSLIHSVKEAGPTKAVINSAQIARQQQEEPRIVQEFKIAHSCNVPSCSYCHESAEVTTIQDYASQQSVFL